MAQAFITRSAEYRSLYNCSFYSVDMVPAAQRRHFAHGALFLAGAIVSEILYAPCLWAMARGEHVREPCYKMMLMLGVLDMTNIIVSGFETGYFAVVGAVYCTHPDLIYVSGLAGLGIWTAESLTSIILAINRCVTIYDSGLAHQLFHGYRVYVWMTLPIVYLATMVLFSWPPVYSSIYIGWFFNPHLGYFEDEVEKYGSVMHSVHNTVLGPFLFGVYAALFVLQYRKWVQLRQNGGSSSFFGNLVNSPTHRKNMSTFIQVLIISVLHMSASVAYVYMQFYPGFFITLFASYGWLIIQGITPVIYLTMNKSIRRQFTRSCRVKVTQSLQLKGSTNDETERRHDSMR